MRSFIQCFSEGYGIFQKLVYLMLVPFILDLFAMAGRLVRLSPDTISYSVKFSMPVYLPSLSDVYNFPSSTGSVQIGTSPIPSAEPMVAIVGAIVFTGLLAFLAGGYLGTIDAIRRQTRPLPSFFRLCFAFFARLYGYALLWLLIITPAVLLILLRLPAFAIEYVLLVFIIDYFLFLTPFAVVVDGSSFGVALTKSVSIAGRKASSVLPYVILYTVFTAAISFPIHALMNARVTGYLIDAALYAFVGTILVATTLVFYSQVSASRNSDLSISNEPTTGTQTGTV